MSKETNKPAKTLSDGAIKAAIWEQDGPKGRFYTTSFSKTYRDEQGHYQSSQNFTGTDLLKMSVLAKEAYRVTREMHYENRSQSQQTKSRSHSHDRER